MTQVIDTKIELKAEDLTSQIAGHMSERFRDWESAYRYMSEDQQNDIIRDTKRAAEHLVEEVVRVIADKGFNTVKGSLKKTENNGDVLKGTIEIPHHAENAEAFIMAAGGVVRITLADPEEFNKGEDPKADPDQQSFDVGESGQDEAA